MKDNGVNNAVTVAVKINDDIIGNGNLLCPIQRMIVFVIKIYGKIVDGGSGNAVAKIAVVFPDDLDIPKGSAENSKQLFFLRNHTQKMKDTFAETIFNTSHKTCVQITIATIQRDKSQKYVRDQSSYFVRVCMQITDK